MPRSRSFLLAAMVVLALSTAACGGEAPAAGPEVGFDRVTEATLAPGEPVPVPNDEVVLRLTGDIATTNVDGALELDLATLESIGLVSYDVDDNQAEGRRVTFTGVLLRDLLDVAGAAPSAETLEMTALNDYVVEVPVADADASPVMIATQSDGDRMPVSNYGPTRVVYPYDSHDLSPIIHDPRWIWQLATISVG